jgi:hypothetical protein
MKDDYLFEGKGEVDPEVEALEAALRPLRYRERAQTIPAPLTRTRVRIKQWRSSRLVGALVLAATLLLGVGIWHARHAAEHLALIDGPAFNVFRETGTPTIAGSAFADQGHLHEGMWLETNSESRAKIQVASIGAVTVAPGSRVQLVRTGPSEHRLSLTKGRIDAVVSAPPRLFVVDTPSATAVDLGCAYHLEVQGDGATRLVVDTGQVSLDGKGKEAWVPAGAECVTRKELGPGTPRWNDSPAAFRTALDAFDWGQGSLDIVLREADTAETLSLWHLLQRVPATEREKVAERIEALAPTVLVAKTVTTSLDAAELLKLRRELSEIW